MANIGNKILELRLEKKKRDKKWTQKYLADQVGVHVTHISAIERGASPGSIKLLEKIATVLETTVAYLVAEESETA